MPTFPITRRSLIKSACASGGLPLVAWTDRALAQHAGPRTFGIDVSKWAGEIDWHAVAAELNPRFVLMQAYHAGRSETSSYANPRFENYRQALLQVGLLNGAYLRCHPNAHPEILINKFWAVYAPQSGDILPSFDIEEDYDDRCVIPVRKRINQIEKLIELATSRLGGRKPMIYTKARVWSALGNPAQFADCPLWVVDYHSTGAPLLPPTWSRFSFWQFAQNLHGNGVQGTYDNDYFNGSEEDLRGYLL